MIRRMLHSKIFESKQFSRLNPQGKLLYIGLIVIADDEGRFMADSKYLRSKIFPYASISPKKIEKIVKNIEAEGLIVLYSAKDSKKNEIFGYHPNWERYQTLKKERLKLSTIPPFPTTKCQPNDNQMSAQDKIREEKKKEDKGVSSSLENLLSSYREKIGIPSDKDLQELKSLYQEHGKYLLKAINIAHNKKEDLKYVKGILHNWKTEGYPKTKKKPFYAGSSMSPDLQYVIVDGEKKEFSGKKEDIVWQEE